MNTNIVGCHNCKHIIYRKEKMSIGGIWNIPICSKGVTNNIKDIHRTEGKCQLFDKKPLNR